MLKNETPLQRALRKTQRKRKFPQLLEFLSPRLGIPPEEIQAPSLEKSDAILDAYRAKMAAEPAKKQRRLTFRDRADLAAAFEELKRKLPNEIVYLYSTHFCDVCGAVNVPLDQFLDRALELVVLNAHAVYVIPEDSENCIDLTFDTEYNSESKPGYYILTLKGDRYVQHLGGGIEGA